MKQLLLTLVITCATCIPGTASAQADSRTKFELGISANVFVYDAWWYGGPGFNGKILFPIRNNNYFTAGLDYSVFIERDPEYENYTYNFLGASGGYRIMMNHFFVEPKFGMGIYWEKEDQPAFQVAAGVEAGYQFRQITVSVDPKLWVPDPFFMPDLYPALGIKIAVRF